MNPIRKYGRHSESTRQPMMMVMRMCNRFRRV